MATPLGTSFSSDEKIVLHTDTKILGSFAQMLVIEFDQAKFEESIFTNKVSSTATVRSCNRIHHSANLGVKMTSACEKATFAEDSLSLAGSQTNFAKSEGNLTLALSKDQDVTTFDLGLQSSTPLGVRFKASRDARYAQGNKIIIDDPAGQASGQRLRKQRLRVKITSEVGTHTNLREFITLKRDR